MITLQLNKCLETVALLLLLSLCDTGLASGPEQDGTTLAATGGTSTASMLDETSIILFGDHGLVTSGRYVDLVEFFNTRHLNAVDVSTLPHLLFRERLGTLWTEWPDVILVSGGSNITQVYLKQSSGNWLRQEADDAAGLDTHRDSRIDWILLSPGLAFRSYTVLPDIVSDHQAVLAEVVLADDDTVAAAATGVTHLY